MRLAELGRMLSNLLSMGIFSSKKAEFIAIKHKFNIAATAQYIHDIFNDLALTLRSSEWGVD